MSVLFIIIPIVLLIYLAFKGWPMLILGPLLAMLVAFLTRDMPALYALTGPFMETTAGYIGSYFPIFLTGALFGKIMGDTGAATSIAIGISKTLGVKHAILATVVATALLTYGGVSLFVVVFAVYPIGVALFRVADVPKRLLPGAITLGAFTFSMTALPGSPQYLNSMPNNYLGTDIYAAPILGIIASIIMLFSGVAWLQFRAKAANKNHEGFGEVSLGEEKFSLEAKQNIPSFFMSIIPILLVIILNALLVSVYFTDTAVRARYADFGGIDGNWPVTISLLFAIVLSFVIYRKYIPNYLELLSSGAHGSLAPIFNTAVIVGFGGVIKFTTAFELFKTWVIDLPIDGLFKVALSSTLIAGIVGSSSGGIGIALEALSTDFLAMDIPRPIIHRILLIASGGLDSLPHCGAVVTVLAICGISHRKGYLDIGMVTMFFPVLACIAVILLYLLTGIF